MLRIHATAIELVRDVMPLIREMIREIERSDPDPARQGRRALTSGPLNIAEGSDLIGKRRALHYRIALGSERETWSVLMAAHACGYIEAPSQTLKNKFDHVIGTLHRCVYPRLR